MCRRIWKKTTHKSAKSFQSGQFDYHCCYSANHIITTTNLRHSILSHLSHFISNVHLADHLRSSQSWSITMMPKKAMACTFLYLSQGPTFPCFLSALLVTYHTPTNHKLQLQPRRVPLLPVCLHMDTHACMQTWSKVHKVLHTARTRHSRSSSQSVRLGTPPAQRVRESETSERRTRDSIAVNSKYRST